MKEVKIYLIALFALGIGLFLGYLLFNGSNAHQHEMDGVAQIESSSQIWTCSMHTQIQSEEEGECPICGMDLVQMDNSQKVSEDKGLQMTEDAIQLANIQTSVIGQSGGPGEGSLELNGKIQADETMAASLVSQIPGRIEKLFISFTGEEVKKGQKIARIYSPELITAQKELLEAKKIADISPGLLTAAKNKLRFWKISETVVEEILASEEIRENFDIYAEHSGVVSNRRVKVGDHLEDGEVLFDIQNLSTLWALFDVYESDLAKVKVGGRITFTSPSIPERSFVSKITFIDPVIDPQTRVARIRTEVKNLTSSLKPDMFIRGSLSTRQKSGNLLVPKSAVLWTGERSVVYIKLPNQVLPSFEYREVELGEAVGEAYLIKSGLEEGEEVVTNGAFVIDASSQLNNKSSMMNRNVTLKGHSLDRHKTDFTASTPIEFKKQLTDLVFAYLSLKDALVATDVEASAENVGILLDKLSAVDMALLEGEAHQYWMEIVPGLRSHGGKIQELAEIEAQRKQFDFLSQLLIESVKVFGIENATFYVQHCPMANNDQGADWLSQEKEILNPYFGSKMLRCGLVQDTLGSQ